MPGRKRKFAIGDRVIGREDGHRGAYRERKGTIVEYAAHTFEYAVKFDDTQTIEYVQACYLEALPPETKNTPA